MINPFFKNKGPFKIDKLLKFAAINNFQKFKDLKIYDIKDLSNSSNKDITFFHSKKYDSMALKTKASFCITSKNLQNYLPNKCKKIIVNNVLLATAKITKIFYPDSVTDDFDDNVEQIEVHYKWKELLGLEPQTQIPPNPQYNSEKFKKHGNEE